MENILNDPYNKDLFRKLLGFEKELKRFVNPNDKVVMTIKKNEKKNNSSLNKNWYKFELVIFNKNRIVNKHTFNYTFEKKYRNELLKIGLSNIKFNNVNIIDYII